MRLLTWWIPLLIVCCTVFQPTLSERKKFPSDDDENKEVTAKHSKAPSKAFKEPEVAFGKKFNKRQKPVDDSDEVYEKKRWTGEKCKGEKCRKVFATEESDADEDAKAPKHHSGKKQLKEDSSEETSAMETKSLEEDDDEPEKIFRKKIRVRVPDSSEEDTCDKKSKGKKGKKDCLEDEDVPGKKKRIKYSIKFAHEKQKSSPSQDDNIMKKIHRGEKKRYKYQDDDDDDSSEEHGNPKRLRFLDDDDD